MKIPQFFGYHAADVEVVEYWQAILHYTGYEVAITWLGVATDT
jgi:hypothetical protein